MQANSLPRIFNAGAPYMVLSSTSGSVSPIARTRSKVADRGGMVRRTRSVSSMWKTLSSRASVELRERHRAGQAAERAAFRDFTSRGQQPRKRGAGQRAADADPANAERREFRHGREVTSHDDVERCG